MTRLVIKRSSPDIPAINAAEQAECRKAALHGFIRLLARISADEIINEMRRDPATETPPKCDGFGECKTISTIAQR